MNRLKKYGFKDENGHPLENCADYQDIFYEHKTALEQAEARAERAESAQLHLCQWLSDIAVELGCDCDNEAMLLAAHDTKERAERAEANVARLTKMVDWLADKCAVHCSDKCADDANFSIASCLMQHCRHTTAEEWKEAASRAVAAGEG